MAETPGVSGAPSARAGGSSTEPGGRGDSVDDRVDQVAERDGTGIATASSNVRDSHRNEAVDLGFEVVIDDRDASPLDRSAAERYLDGLVLRLLAPGEGDTSSPDVSPPTGVISITLEDGEVSAAEVLARMIETDAPSLSSSVDRGLRAILGGRVSAWQLHGWLEHRFFEHHIEQNGGNPLVWHLSTPSGAFQVLARAEALDPQRIKTIRDWARTTQDRLGRALADAGRSGDTELVESIRSRRDEVRSLDGVLGDMARNGWRVGGSLDRGAKLAVLQSRGVVAPVRAPAE